MRGLWLALALALSWPPGALAQALTKLPMPQSFRPDELRVQWESDANPPGTVNALDWGASSVAQNSVVASETIRDRLELGGGATPEVPVFPSEAERP
jgi:hypothetical protein